MLSLYIYECFVSTLRLSSHWSFAVNHRLTSTNQIISRRAPNASGASLSIKCSRNQSRKKSI